MELRRKIYILAGLGTVCLLGLIAGILTWQLVDWGEDEENTEEEYYLPPSHSELGVYPHAAVATDAPHCADIGKSFLEKRGGAADAAIATALCVGLIQSQSMGLGGGFMAVYYNASSKKAMSLNARERAPAAATWDMFANNPEASARGKLSVAVPGELKGYWELHEKAGKLPWKTLFQPTIDLALNGFPVTAHAANALWSNRRFIKESPTMRDVFINPATNEVFLENDTMTRPDLAATLKTISESYPGDVLYQSNSTLMRNLVDDLREQGGILTYDDMINYKVVWDEHPIKMNVTGNFTVYSTSAPGSGVLLAFSLKVLSLYGDLIDGSLVTYQRIVETFKHAYAKRTLLGDMETNNETIKAEIQQVIKNLTDDAYIREIFSKIRDSSTSQDYKDYGAEFYQPDDHGTAHLCVVAPDGDAIALTSTINLYHGSRIRSVRTGIIFNDQMDDFSNPNVTNQFNVPPSPNNFIEPGRHPMSSMTPAIFTDNKGKVRLVVGGAGGTKITTAVASVAIRNLWFGESIKQAIDARRIHHQLAPMQAEYENGFNTKIVDGLKRIGHKMEEFPLGTSVVQGIAVSANGTIYANSDFRKVGTIAGY